MTAFASSAADEPHVLASLRHDWLESLEDVLQTHGPDRVRQLMRDLQIYAQKQGVVLPVTSQTPYINTEIKNGKKKKAARKPTRCPYTLDFLEDRADSERPAPVIPDLFS